MGELEGVELAEGAYSGDYLYTTDEEQRVLHVMSLQEHMNQVAVSEGRLPEKAGECLADDFSDYEIGDTITLESGTDDDISDTLSTDTLEVVGLGNSPCYLSYGVEAPLLETGISQHFSLCQRRHFPWIPIQKSICRWKAPKS